MKKFIQWIAAFATGCLISTVFLLSSEKSSFEDALTQQSNERQIVIDSLNCINDSLNDTNEKLTRKIIDQYLIVDSIQRKKNRILTNNKQIDVKIDSLYCDSLLIEFKRIFAKYDIQ